MEMYNNILVFTVADDSGSGQRAEMHIFQCQSVSAQDLVEDLKMLQMGKLVTGGSPRGPRGHIPPPPALPPPEPPLNGVNVREQVSAFNAANGEYDIFDRLIFYTVENILKLTHISINIKLCASLRINYKQ